MSQQNPEEVEEVLEPDTNPEDSPTSSSDSSGDGDTSPPTRRTGRRFNKWIIAAIVGVLVLIIGAGVAVAVFVLTEISHTPEETANYLPEDTAFYMSLNMRPGAGQILEFIKIRDAYLDNRDFEDGVDDAFSDVARLAESM